MSHTMARGGTCGRPDGHRGRCYSVEYWRRRLEDSRRYERENRARLNARRRQVYADESRSYRSAQLQRYYDLRGAAYAKNLLLKRRWKAVKRMQEREERQP